MYGEWLYFMALTTYPGADACPDAVGEPLPSAGSDHKFHLYKCRTPAGLSTCSRGWGAANPGLLMHSPSKHRKSTETNRCLAKGDVGTCSAL